MRLPLTKIGLKNLSSLVGYWNFDSDYTDQEGSNDLTASATGVSRGASRDEFSNGAIFSTGYLQNTSMGDVPTGDNDITLNCWFKHISLLEQKIIMYKGSSSTSGGLGFKISASSDIAGVVDSTEYDLGIVNNFRTDGDWNMITITYDSSASEVVFYYNGVPIITETISNRAFAQDLIIGNFTTSGSDPIISSGIVDEVSLFSDALSGDQVKQLFSHPGLGGDIDTDDIMLL